jgi:3-oxoadipyl-CoA thiolase
MNRAYIIDGVRTPIGRYAGALSSVRPDDLAAHVLRELCARQSNVDWTEVDDVVLGCVNQAGEDNRNVARMALLLGGLPETVSGSTVNRLCGSGVDAVAIASRAIVSGQADLVIAGGVESMSRAPLVQPKPTKPFSRNAEIYDSTMGWRFINPAMQAAYGTDSMGETAENVATERGISRAAQDEFALRSQERARKALADGTFEVEIAPVPVPGRAGRTTLVSVDEHPRETTLEALSGLRPVFRDEGTVTAGNSSGVNDGSAAVLVASERAVRRFGLTPLARVAGAATVGVAPRVMGLGPIPAVRTLLSRTGVSIDDIGVFELNEAFAAQALAVLRDLGIDDDAEHVNPHGGAIALGHPLGMSGARLVLTAARELQRRDARHGLVSMCIGVGQGIALQLEGVA